MVKKYDINNDGIITFHDRKEMPETEHDKLMKEYAELEHVVVSSVAHKTNDPKKIARFHELKKILGIPETRDVFEQATEKLKQMGPLNAGLSEAIAKFKQRNVDK